MTISLKNLTIGLLVIAVLAFSVAAGFYFWKGRGGGTENVPLVNESIVNQTNEEPGQEEAVNVPLDSDQDLLTDDKEKELGTNPQNRDTDGDGLEDSLEIRMKHDPLVKDFNSGSIDSDKDGLTDEEEKFLGTDSNEADTDGDGIYDTGEIMGGTDPDKTDDFSQSGIEILSDTDKDGLPDKMEKEYGTDPAKADTDGDGLSDYEEIYLFGTNPLNPDTDGDGYKDGEEVKAGYNPKGQGKLVI